MAKIQPLPRCQECLSVGCHRTDCETGKRERAERDALRAAALDAPARNRMLSRPFGKK